MAFGVGVKVMWGVCVMYGCVCGTGAETERLVHTHYKVSGFPSVSIHSYMCVSLPTHIQSPRFSSILGLFHLNSACFS